MWIWATVDVEPGSLALSHSTVQCLRFIEFSRRVAGSLLPAPLRQSGSDVPIPPVGGSETVRGKRDTRAGAHKWIAYHAKRRDESGGGERVGGW